MSLSAPHPTLAPLDHDTHPPLSDPAADRRRRRIENLIGLCWGLITLKALFVVWLVNHYAMPFNPLWVIGPTVAMALIATTLYYCVRD
jgi:hypothetical protein